jgi:hypothetical protein
MAIVNTDRPDEASNSSSSSVVWKISGHSSCHPRAIYLPQWLCIKEAENRSAFPRRHGKAWSLTPRYQQVTLENNKRRAFGQDENNRIQRRAGWFKTDGGLFVLDARLGPHRATETALMQGRMETGMVEAGSPDSCMAPWPGSTWCRSAVGKIGTGTVHAV